MNLGFATKLLGNTADAEEVMQEAFTRVWKYSKIWDQSSNAQITPWCYCVVTHLCHHVRSQETHPELNEELAAV